MEGVPQAQGFEAEGRGYLGTVLRRQGSGVGEMARSHRGRPTQELAEAVEWWRGVCGWGVAVRWRWATNPNKNWLGAARRPSHDQRGRS